MSREDDLCVSAATHPWTAVTISMNEGFKEAPPEDLDHANWPDLM